MCKFELKKIFLRTSNQIAMLLLAVLLIVTCYFATHVNYVNENGISETGFTAIAKLKSAQKAWSGYLDEEKIQQVIAENNRICRTPQAQSKDWRENNIAYGWQQGFADIRELLNRSYAERFQSYDYYRADSLKEEDASLFYKNRIALLKAWLADEAKEQFSEDEKEYLIQQYETLDTPFYYDYMKGWEQLLEFSPTVIMVMMLVLGYLVAGIFANEFTWKADAVFFASVYGRNKAVAAKMKAAFLMVTSIYWVIVLLYSGIVLLYLGADGASCPVQISGNGWKSFYNITIGQKYFLTIIGGYIGCMFLSFLCMLVSAKTKSAVVAVMIPFIMIFLPSFLTNINSPVMNKVLALLPDRLLQVGGALQYFDLYAFGGKMVGAVPILLVLYSVFSVFLLPVIYRVYRRKRL